MQVTLYSMNNIMIEEKSIEIDGNRFPIKRDRSKSPIRNSTSKAYCASRPTRDTSSSRERRRVLRSAVDSHHLGVKKKRALNSNLRIRYKYIDSTGRGHYGPK